MRNKKNLNLFSLSDYFSNYQNEYLSTFSTVNASIDRRIDWHARAQLSQLSLDKHSNSWQLLDATQTQNKNKANNAT